LPAQAGFAVSTIQEARYSRVRVVGNLAGVAVAMLADLFSQGSFPKPMLLNT
jgi:hypothetical protein